MELVGPARVEEVEDRETPDFPTAAYDTFVTCNAVIGRALGFDVDDVRPRTNRAGRDGRLLRHAASGPV